LCPYIRLQVIEFFFNHLEGKEELNVKIELTNVNFGSTIKPVRLKRKKLVLCLLSTFLLICLLILPAAARVTELKISPQKPGVGDTIKVTGKASPGESIRAQVTLNQRVSVSGGRYQLAVNGIKVPVDTSSRFTIEAYGVKNLHVKVNKLVTIFDTQVIGHGGIARITKGSVPSLTYDVLMDGDAYRGSAVYLMITASQTLKADSKGRFESIVDTSSMPVGKYSIRVGGIERTIQLRPKGQGPSKPVATFSAYPTYGKLPLKVKFTDKSKGSPTSWYWSFGDGSSSTEQNPVHIYKRVGKYTVTLTVENEAGINTAAKSRYIKVSKSNNLYVFDGLTYPLANFLV
jgi:hypothetical protein